MEWKDGKVKKRGQEYDDIKMKIGAQMWKQVEELFPQLEGKVPIIVLCFQVSQYY